MRSVKKITTEEMKELVNTLNMEGEEIGYVKATKECIMMHGCLKNVAKDGLCHMKKVFTIKQKH